MLGQDGAEMVLGVCGGTWGVSRSWEMSKPQRLARSCALESGHPVHQALGGSVWLLIMDHKELVSSNFFRKKIREFVGDLNQNYSLPLSPRPRTASRLSGTPFQESAMNLGDASSIFFFSSLYLKEITCLHYKSAFNVKL